MPQGDVFKSTQDPFPVRMEPDDDWCGTGRLWWLLHHRPGPPPPPWWISGISEVIGSLNQFVASSFIPNEALAQQVRIDAAKNLVASAEKFSSSVKEKKAVAA